MFTKAIDGTLHCSLCSHNCHITERHAGFCRVRENIDGKLHLPYYGLISGISNDPVEKKPLYHYYPGTMVISVGYWGCNFRCPYCQNWSISQNLPSSPAAKNKWTPESLTQDLKQKKLTAVCHTYSEPEIHFEFVYETVRCCKENNIDSLLVTNGSLQKLPAEMLYREMKAVNIDLKAFNSDYYRKTLHGDLETVMSNIEIAAENTHLEVTMLIIPGINDDAKSIKGAAQFIASLEKRNNKSIPLHLSRYFPQYTSDIDATPISTMDFVHRIAAEKLEYVYLGNVSQASNTYCPRCSTLCIERAGYSIRTFYTTENGPAQCPQCDYVLPILI